MHYFEYNQNELSCEGVRLQKIADEVGTPVYVYSERTLKRHVDVFESAFSAVPHLICYAVKANSNLTLLRRFAEWGLGFDIVSAGELFRVRRAGGDTTKVIFSGVGKTDEEIRFALDSDILLFNVESPAELEAIQNAARAHGRRARVSIRTNPHVDPRTHPYISTGMQKHKFGIAFPEARELYNHAATLSHVEIAGVGCHIGSQITELDPFREALLSLRGFVLDLKAAGLPIRFLDFGGGLGIPYNDEEPPSPAVYAAEVINKTRDLGLTLVLEPGRVIVGNAGILLTRVIRTKTQSGKSFVIVDAAMNDMIRPALYHAFHQILPVRQSANSTARGTFDVVGPVCESADFLAHDRDMPTVVEGDLLAVMSAGAYGFVQSSNYNSRPRLPEVLVRGEDYRVVRRRETLEDLIRGEE